MKSRNYFNRNRNNDSVSKKQETVDVTGQASKEATTDESNELQTKGLLFGEAIEALKLGMKVTRPGWNGKGMFLELQRPDTMSKMTLPYIYMFTADENRVPWLASQTDMLSEDWEILID